MDGIGPQLEHAGLNLEHASREVRHQVESDVFGFWIFLMTDAVVFALLFAIYGTSLQATAGGPGGPQEFKMSSAFIETMLLLTSSFTFGLTSLALKRNAPNRSLVTRLVVTLVLGVCFLAMEGHDFITMASHGATPDRSGFLSAFFVLVGMHGFHVASGVIWGVVMLLQIRFIGRDDQVRINLIRLSLFWHFLDVVWIVIFSVVYLQGLATPGAAS